MGEGEGRRAACEGEAQDVRQRHGDQYCCGDQETQRDPAGQRKERNRQV